MISVALSNCSIRRKRHKREKKNEKRKTLHANYIKLKIKKENDVVAR